MLAGRYRLEERIATTPDGSFWRGVDETLDRQAGIRVLLPGHRNAADAADAARRAALIDDPRLLRIIDVGTEGPSTYIVSEYVRGRTLAEVLAAAPLPAETVRRLVGEAAQALERAGGRGLHHLCLSPTSLLVAADGTVRVTGLAVEAALIGLDENDPAAANRVDAVALVSIVYAGLTGRWPGALDGPLGPAPRITGQAVPPGDLVAGVPDDLDALCMFTLGPRLQGPHSPGEVAQALAPWARAEPLTSPRGLLLTGPSRPRAEGAAALEAPAPSPRIDHSLFQPRVRAPHVAPVPQVSPVPPTSTGTSSPAPSPSAAPVTPTRPTEYGAAEYGAAEYGAAEYGAAESRAAEYRAAESRAAEYRAATQTVPLSDWALVGEPVAQTQPPAPFLPPAPTDRPPRDQSRLVLIVLAVFVVLGLIFAVRSLTTLGQGAPLVPDRAGVQPGTAGAPTAQGSPTGTADQASSPSPSAAPSPSVGAPVGISGIQALDPQGDGNENGATAPRAIDADASTNWRSDRYQSPAFGGLKAGLGLYLVLDTRSTIHQVVVNGPGRGGTIEVRTTEGPGLDGSTVVGTGSFSNGQASITLKSPAVTDKLLLWCTALPQQDNGDNRLIIAEITAR